MIFHIAVLDYLLLCKKAKRINRKINPTKNNMGVLYCIESSYVVAIQLIFFLPIGMAIFMVAISTF